MTRKKPKGDYTVGYGRPPVATRFRPGGVGNPKGRPKSQKSLGQLIEDAFKTRIRNEENGQSKSLPAEAYIFKRLVHAAARGDLRATRLVFELRDRYRDNSETTLDLSELAPEDRQIIDSYFATRRDDGTKLASEAKVPTDDNDKLGDEPDGSQ